PTCALFGSGHSMTLFCAGVALIAGSSARVSLRSPLLRRTKSDADAGTFGNPARRDHLCAYASVSSKAVIGCAAHAVVIQPIDREAARWTRPVRCRQGSVEDWALQLPIRVLQERAVFSGIRRVEV